jgi:hypothetical protein
MAGGGNLANGCAVDKRILCSENLATIPCITSRLVPFQVLRSDAKTAHNDVLERNFNYLVEKYL